MYKYLGVFLDKNLSWKPHIEYICQKISKSCGILNKLRNCIELETLREVYHALIHSYLRYGIIAWGTAAKSNLNPLQTLINRAIRIMSFSPFGQVDLKPLYEILEILRVEEIYTLEVAKFTFKQKNRTLPDNLAGYFKIEASVSNRRKKHQVKYRVLSNTASGTKSIQQKSIEIWDQVPEEIKDALSMKSFKNMLKSHLILVNSQ